MKVAVVGANGIVGRQMLGILSSCEVELYALGRRSVGQVIDVGEMSYPVSASEDFDFGAMDGVVMSAGHVCASQVRASLGGAWLIDNSSAFRREDSVALVVPEIFQETVGQVVASPNCVAIPMVLVLSLLQEWGLEGVWGSTYQSVSGAGMQAMRDLDSQQGVYDSVRAEIGSLGDDGVTGEEDKIQYEVNKILGIDIPVSVMAVRVPVRYGHSMHLRVTLASTVNMKELLEKFRDCPYIKLYEDAVPEPRDAKECHQVHVGRVQVKDRVVGLWVVSDNVYRGAAWNVCEIAKRFFAVKEMR